jgi:hypothetical protein
MHLHYILKGMKILITVSAGILGTLGAFIPYLWGDTNFLSGWSILFSALAGLLGIWVGYKIGKRYL